MKVLLAAAMLLAFGGVVRADDAEHAFMAENGKAMSTMMANMTVKPSGDVDRDFVAIMVPHHQGAIDMARAELRYGRNAQLRRMAQDIIAAQTREITEMRTAVGGASAGSAPMDMNKTP